MRCGFVVSTTSMSMLYNKPEFAFIWFLRPWDPKQALVCLRPAGEGDLGDFHYCGYGYTQISYLFLLVNLLSRFSPCAWWVMSLSLRSSWNLRNLGNWIRIPPHSLHLLSSSSTSGCSRLCSLDKLGRGVQSRVFAQKSSTQPPPPPPPLTERTLQSTGWLVT